MIDISETTVEKLRAERPHGTCDFEVQKEFLYGLKSRHDGFVVRHDSPVHTAQRVALPHVQIA
jgi:hypothetical protein